MSETEVSLRFDDVFWNIVPIAIDCKDNGILVELQWGWTAGMSEEEIARLAEDSPQGCESVTTTLEMAKELRDKLDEIVKRYGG
jgi:hypothetical protein